MALRVNTFSRTTKDPILSSDSRLSSSDSSISPTAEWKNQTSQPGVINSSMNPKLPEFLFMSLEHHSSRTHPSVPCLRPFSYLQLSIVINAHALLLSFCFNLLKPMVWDMEKAHLLSVAPYKKKFKNCGFQKSTNFRSQGPHFFFYSLPIF